MQAYDGLAMAFFTNEAPNSRCLKLASGRSVRLEVLLWSCHYLVLRVRGDTGQLTETALRPQAESQRCVCTWRQRAV